MMRQVVGMVREIKPLEELLNEIVYSAQDQMRLLRRYAS